MGKGRGGERPTYEQRRQAAATLSVFEWLEANNLMTGEMAALRTTFMNTWGEVAREELANADPPPSWVQMADLIKERDATRDALVKLDDAVRFHQRHAASRPRHVTDERLWGARQGILESLARRLPQYKILSEVDHEGNPRKGGLLPSDLMANVLGQFMTRRPQDAKEATEVAEEAWTAYRQFEPDGAPSGLELAMASVAAEVRALRLKDEPRQAATIARDALKEAAACAERAAARGDGPR